MTTSIIIPVYNTSATLDECVASVLAQDCRDMEVVLVDDGSDDGSGALCDAWARRDARVRVCHRPNGGLSAARNTGIMASGGAYLMFVDSDDTLAPGTVAAATAALDADSLCDMAEFPISRTAGDTVSPLFAPAGHAYDDTRAYWFRTRAYAHSYACNKIFRRRLFGATRFPEGRVFEDMHVLPLLLAHCRRVRTVGHGCYLYRANPHGITATATLRGLSQLLDAHLAAMPAFCAAADHAPAGSAYGQADADAYYMHVLNIQIDCCRMGARPRLPWRRVALRRMPPRMMLKAVALRLTGVWGTCLFLGGRPRRDC